MLAAWAYFRLMHTPLASTVQMEAWEYESARFVYAAPRSVQEALADADSALCFRNAGKETLIDEYLNGDRTLSNEKLSYLIVGCTRDEERALPTPAHTPALEMTEEQAFENEECQFDILICTTHFLGDGMALHTFANEFFALVGGPSPESATGALRTTEEIESLLESEWEKRWGTDVSTSSSVLPLSLEDLLPPVEGRLRQAAGKVDHQNNQKKLIVRSLSQSGAVQFELKYFVSDRVDMRSRSGGAQTGRRSSRQFPSHLSRPRRCSGNASQTAFPSPTLSSRFLPSPGLVYMLARRASVALSCR